MGNYDRYELQGREREEALARFTDQMTRWGLTMPSVTPLVCHFGLGEFEKTGLIECWIANEVTAGYCGKFLFVFDGQTCPLHRHARKHETFFVVKGAVRMIVDGAEVIRKEGDLLAMPPSVEHSFTGLAPALLLETSSPCLLQDNFFADRRIGECGVI